MGPFVRPRVSGIPDCLAAYCTFFFFFSFLLCSVEKYLRAWPGTRAPLNGIKLNQMTL